MSNIEDELFGLKSSRTGEYFCSKTSDKMFEELGYKKLKNEEIVWYQKKTKFITKDIIFDLEKKMIYIEISHYDKKGNLLKIEGTLTVKELQAINKKVEELDWNE